MKMLKSTQQLFHMTENIIRDDIYLERKLYLSSRDPVVDTLTILLNRR